ncbi:adenosine 5'-monophosphoramidase HINT3 isoform X2 [Myxocyprinus asiaticus]|uniref:adenosine 5'-monophosphoramidase HINT3 isoform X2 n=1 Tax=Myxocyprinus asiaticus TaxID=70543 RepID=UPI0022230275|nr:adenosine 5'-monophosphoramidase HINT3 isoform X2 [Myxocyprinus asiaticus]
MTEEKCSEENKRYSSNDSSDSDCTFCLIARGDHPHTHILVDDKDIVCFQDINPGALHHYLVVPKKHIHSCLSFKADDISLVRRMAEIGKAVLKAKNVTDFEDIRVPCATIYHRSSPAPACSCTFQSTAYRDKVQVYRLLVPHCGKVAENIG